MYRNLCEMERDRCNREDSIVLVDASYCKLRMPICLIDKYFFLLPPIFLLINCQYYYSSLNV
jgi:hypothetical protein